MNKFEKIIDRFNKKVVDPMNFEMTMEGYQEYLDAMGIKFVSAKEMCTPHNASVASELGYNAFVPQRDWWARGGALAALFDHLRADLGKPIVVRNWWRPEDYNKKVGGAKASDHIGAYAFDMDFKSHEQYDVEWPLDNENRRILKVLQSNPSMMPLIKIDYWKIDGKIFIHRIIND